MLAVSEDKIDTCNNIYIPLEPIGKYKKLKEEEEEIYYPAPELFSTMLSDEAFTGQLNFQYSLGTGGTNQDWLVRTLINFLYYVETHIKLYNS